MTSSSRDAAPLPERRLSMLDCASMTIGIIIGSGIYEAPSIVAAQPGGAGVLVGTWLAGGLFALVGAWCYAELATRFPQQGGDYVYLSQAFGRSVGLLFAWTQLWVIRPGSIGAMACVFAAYALALQAELFPGTRPDSIPFLFYACGSVGVLSLVNVAGVPLGKSMQNFLTAAKVLGLALVVVAGFAGAPEIAPPIVADAARADAGPTFDGLTTAMIFVLFAYSGWNEIGCVTAEIRDPRRNLGRSLLLAAGVVTTIYVGVNLACLNVLGLDGMARSSAVAGDAVTRVWGRPGSVLVSLLICVSALGSTNGMIFTGARIYYALGHRHAVFAPLGWWSRRFGTPWLSLVVQGVVTSALVVGFSRSGSAEAGRYDFQRLVMFMTPPFYVFLALSAAAVVWFRLRGRGAADAYRSPLFPLPPLLMAAGSVFLAVQGVKYAWGQWNADKSLWWPAAWVGGTLASGLAAAAWERMSVDDDA